MNRSLLYSALIAVTAAAIGFWAGRLSGVSPAPDAVEAAPAPKRAEPAKKPNAFSDAKPLVNPRLREEKDVAPVVETVVAPRAIAATEARPDISLARITAAANMRDPVARLEGLAELLRGLTPQNAQSILEAFRLERGDRNNWQERQLIMDAWGRVDGPAAIAYAEKNGDPQGVNSALTGWAMTSPEQAKQWATKQSTEADNPWMVPVIAGAARNNLSAAVAMLYALPYGAARGSGLDPVIEAYAQQGLYTLRNWAECIPDPRLRDGASARVAPRLAADDPAGAARWALEHVSEERMPQAIIPLIAQWTQTDPAAAVAWSESLAEGQARSMALDHAVNMWAHKDPAAAETWLLKAPPGGSYDNARMMVALRYMQNDPVRAMSWVSTMSDEQRRNQTLERIAASWRQRDPEAAAKFFNNP